MKIEVDKSNDIIKTKTIKYTVTLNAVERCFQEQFENLNVKEEYREVLIHEEKLSLELREYVDDYLSETTAYSISKTLCNALNIAPPNGVFMHSHRVPNMFEAAYDRIETNIHFRHGDCRNIVLIHELTHHYINMKRIKYKKLHGEEFMEAEQLLVDTLITLC